MGAGKCSSPACRCTAFKPMQTSYGQRSRLCTRAGCGHDMGGHGDPACRYSRSERNAYFVDVILRSYLLLICVVH